MFSLVQVVSAPVFGKLVRSSKPTVASKSDENGRLRVKMPALLTINDLGSSESFAYLSGKKKSCLGLRNRPIFGPA